MGAQSTGRDWRSPNENTDKNIKNIHNGQVNIVEEQQLDPAETSATNGKTATAWMVILIGVVIVLLGYAYGKCKDWCELGISSTIMELEVNKEKWIGRKNTFSKWVWGEYISIKDKFVKWLGNVGGNFFVKQSENAAYVEVPCEEAINKKLVLLVDTGADSSLVKYSALSKGVNLDKRDLKNLGGAFGGYTRTQGSIRVGHIGLKGISFRLHVVKSDTGLPADGILGRDSIWGKTVINTCKQELVFIDDSEKEVLKFKLGPLKGSGHYEEVSRIMTVESRTMRPIKIR